MTKESSRCVGDQRHASPTPPTPARRRGAGWAGVGAVLAVLAACSGDSDPQPVALASADSFTVDWNGERRLAVLDNDTVREGSPTLSVATAPTQGSVVVQGGALVYTPKPGYFGSDSFSYRLDVDIDGFNANSSTTVNLTVQAQMSLRGVVTDGPLAQATVVAAVGAQRFTTTTDAQGRYSLSVTTSLPSEFVTLTATGVGAQRTVVLTSLVGEVSGLAAAAAADGAVSSNAARGLMVTHLSSAQAGLMAQAGPLPTSNATLLAASQRLDSPAVLDAAALVKLVVDSGVALPAGAATTRDLLQSASLLNAFDSARRLADAAQLAVVREAVLVDPALASAPPVPQSGPVSLLFGYGAGGASTAAFAVELRPDGTATVVSDTRQPSRWRLVGQRLELTYDTPRVQSGLTVGAGGAQFTRESVITGIQVADIAAVGGRYSLAALTRVGYFIDRGGPQVGVRQESSGTQLMRRYSLNPAALKNEDFVVGDRWAGLLSEPMPAAVGGPLTFKQDVLRVTSSGAGTMERKGAAAAWQVASGALLVRVGGDQFRYRRMDLGPLGEERWLMEQLDEQGQALMASEIMVVRVSEVSIDSAGMAKRWQGNINAGVSRSTAFYTLKTDGTWAITTKEAGLPESSAVFNRQWRRLADGRLDMVSVTPSGCNPWVGAANCRITSQRYWNVVGQKGSTLWVMEAGPEAGVTPITSFRFVAMTEALPPGP